MQLSVKSDLSVISSQPPPHRPRAPAWRRSPPSWGWPWSGGCSGGWCSAGGRRRRWWTWRRWCGATWWQTHWRRRKRRKKRMRRWAPVWWPGAPSRGPRRWSPNGPGLCCGAAARSARLQWGRGDVWPHRVSHLSLWQWMFVFPRTYRPYSCPPAGTSSADMPGTGCDELCPLDTCRYRPGTCWPTAKTLKAESPQN